MRKPTFLCIGVQKSGSTSLIKYLSQHNDVYIHPNELHFFDKENYTENYEEYEKNFLTNKNVIGEKTPSYNYLYFAMNRIYNYNKNIKLLLILREPISRAYSNYNMVCGTKSIYNEENENDLLNLFKNESKINLYDIKKRGNHFVARGKYDEIIENIYKQFPRENVYIQIAEEIQQDKLKHYNEIFTFLGVSELSHIDENCDTHIGKYENQIPRKLEKYLYEIYTPHIEKLYKILGRRVEMWDKYYKKIEMMN